MKIQGAFIIKIGLTEINKVAVNCDSDDYFYFSLVFT